MSVNSFELASQMTEKEPLEVLFDVGSTPTLEFIFPEGFDLSICTNIYVTIMQGTVKVRKSGTDIVITGEDRVTVDYDQTDTLKFTAGVAKLKFNFIYANGKRSTSEGEKVFLIGDNFEKEELE